MDLRSLVRLFAKISLALTFVVIIAGSVVRMTGSGMGCPDWPKCFGYLVPPTSAEELSYAEGKSFDEGQMVILNDTLWVAETNVIAGSAFDRTMWKKYEKHDYAIFNVLHTWVEYVNRLATVVYGIPVFILSLLCLVMLIRDGDKGTFLLALFTDIMIGYEIWLGKLVVDGNLKENSITLHMFGSIAIVSLLILLVNRLKENKEKVEVTSSFRWMMLAMLVLVFLQIMLGTQVREAVDIVAKVNDDRSTWIDQLPLIFKIHRSASILVTLLALIIFIKHQKFTKHVSQINLMLFFVFAEIVAGVVLSYFSMPKAMQPLHLLLGVLLFASGFYAMLQFKSSRNQ